MNNQDKFAYLLKNSNIGKRTRGRRTRRGGGNLAEETCDLTPISHEELVEKEKKSVENGENLFETYEIEQFKHLVDYGKIGQGGINVVHKKSCNGNEFVFRTSRNEYHPENKETLDENASDYFKEYQYQTLFAEENLAPKLYMYGILKQANGALRFFSFSEEKLQVPTEFSEENIQDAGEILKKAANHCLLFDLKPQNMLMNPDGTLCLTDFDYGFMVSENDNKLIIYAIEHAIQIRPNIRERIGYKNGEDNKEVIIKIRTVIMRFLFYSFVIVHNKFFRPNKTQLINKLNNLCSDITMIIYSLMMYYAVDNRGFRDARLILLARAMKGTYNKYIFSTSKNLTKDQLATIDYDPNISKDKTANQLFDEFKNRLSQKYPDRGAKLDEMMILDHVVPEFVNDTSTSSPDQYEILTTIKHLSIGETKRFVLSNGGSSGSSNPIPDGIQLTLDYYTSQKNPEEIKVGTIIQLNKDHTRCLKVTSIKDPDPVHKTRELAIIVKNKDHFEKKGDTTPYNDIEFQATVVSCKMTDRVLNLFGFGK